MIHRRRIYDGLSRRSPRNEHAQLERKIEPLFGDGAATAERLECRVGVVAGSKAKLAATVIATLAVLHEESGAVSLRRVRELRCRFDERIRADGDALPGEPLLLPRAIAH